SNRFIDRGDIQSVPNSSTICLHVHQRSVLLNGRGILRLCLRRVRVRLVQLLSRVLLILLLGRVGDAAHARVTSRFLRLLEALVAHRVVALALQIRLAAVVAHARRREHVVEEGVLEKLLATEAMLRIVDEYAAQQRDRARSRGGQLGRRSALRLQSERHEYARLGNALQLERLHVDLHLLELLLVGRAEGGLHQLHLVLRVRSSEQHAALDHLSEHAPGAPYVDQMRVVIRAEKHLGRTVVASNLVGRGSLLRRNHLRRAEVSNLQLSRVTIDEDVDRLDVAMGDAVLREEVDPVEELPDVDLHIHGIEAATDHLVQRLGHVGEDEGLTYGSIGRRVLEDVEQLDDVAGAGASHRSQNDHLVGAHRVLRPGLLDGDFHLLGRHQLASVHVGEDAARVPVQLLDAQIHLLLVAHVLCVLNDRLMELVLLATSFLQSRLGCRRTAWYGGGLLGDLGDVQRHLRVVLLDGVSDSAGRVVVVVVAGGRLRGQGYLALVLVARLTTPAALLRAEEVEEGGHGVSRGQGVGRGERRARTTRRGRER
ncbi:hypothetical protein PENTCL1PPCAC_24823, partial [Pristionchus entomophagus]